MANQVGTAKAKYETSTSSTELSASEPQNALSREQLNEEIARRAYELYEESGRADGDDLLHWLLAEEELSNKYTDGTTHKDSSSERIFSRKK